MGIDWFTLVAQIANFLILVALLKHFLYNRIIKAMDEREERIAATMEEAEAKKKEAEKEAETLRHERSQLEQRREELVDEAKRDAEERRKELVKEARQEAEELRSKWHKAIEHEKDSFLKELRLRASQQVHATVRKVLADLASEELEQRMIETFLGRLRALEQDDRKAIVESLRDSDHRVTIVSTFEISEEQRAQLREAVKRELVKSAEVKFETSRDSICGIVLKADGHQVAWEFEAYLRDLEEAVAGTLEGEMKAQPNSEKTDDGRSS